MIRPVLLWTDLLVLLLAAGGLLYARRVLRSPGLRAGWRRALVRPTGSAAATLLALFAFVGLLDCIHYREPLPATTGAQAAWSPETQSALDALLAGLRERHESAYSAPLAVTAFEKQGVIVAPGVVERREPPLQHAGLGLADPARDAGRDIVLRLLLGLLGGGAIAALHWWAARRLSNPGPPGGPRPLRAALWTISAVLLLAGPVVALSLNYHVLGTDRIGNDVLYRVLKSIRTALVIGTLTTLFTLPLSVGLGMLSGYLRGWVDELIQYVVTVINSIPYVLLIAAAVLLLTVFIDGHPDAFPTSAERTDARLLFLCAILGLTTWTDLARLVRGEVLRLRELEFVQAAQAFGVGRMRILLAHLLPNLLHLILINLVIRFSELVLAEATLSYVGVGVDPAMASFGTLINTARLELGHAPVIWWNLAGAFFFMFTLVLAANFFADAVREAFDPRSARR